MQTDRRAQDIQRQLMEWSTWRRTGHGVRPGYPSVSPMFQGSPFTASRGRGAMIDDEVALGIDRAVSSLRERCRAGNGAISDLRWEVLTESYLVGKSDSVIARRLRVSRQAVKVARRAAESWVEAYLESGKEVGKTDQIGATS